MEKKLIQVFVGEDGEVFCFNNEESYTEFEEWVRARFDEEIVEAVRAEIEANLEDEDELEEFDNMEYEEICSTYGDIVIDVINTIKSDILNFHGQFYEWERDF